MSLIQEALRRKQREEQGLPQAPSELHAPPAPERYVPAAAAVPPVPYWQRALRLACYVIICLGALAGLLSLFRSFQRAEQTPPPVIEAARSPAVVPAAVVPPVAPPAPVAAPVSPPATVPAAVPQPAAPAPPPPPPPPRIPERAAHEWPYLKLTGVFAQPNPTESSALINSEMVDVGGTIRGATLIDVRNTGVLLRWRSQEQFVKVGRATEPTVPADKPASP